MPQPRRAPNPRPMRAIIGTLTIAAALVVSTIVPAQAAGTSRIATADSIIGEDRTVSLEVSCSGSTSCKGSLKLSSAALRTAAKKYSLKKNSTTRISFGLSTSQYRALLKQGSLTTTAVLTQAKPTQRRTVKTLRLVPAQRRVLVAAKSFVIDDSRKIAVKLDCAGPRSCRGTLRPVVSGIRGTANEYSISPRKSATIFAALSKAQQAKLGTKASQQRFEIAEKAPERLTHSVAVSMSRAAAALVPGSGRIVVDDNGRGTIDLSCSGARACSGTITPVVSGVTGTAAKYSMASGAKRRVALKLTTGQLAVLGTASGTSKLLVHELKPNVLSGSTAITVVRAAPAVKVDSTLEHLDATGRAQVTLACAAGADCQGSLVLSVAGVAGAPVAYSISKGASIPLQVPVDANQREGLHHHEATVASFTVNEVLPAVVGHSASAVLRPTSYSVAFTERNWVPTSYDTCPAALHESFNATGPDSKIYPTWHPAQITDPATGKPCTFGHEHGADPTTSDIYDWVVRYLAPEGDTRNLGLPFGYASEELNDYAHDHAGMSMRHEDNGGHKVFLRNDVKLLDLDKEPVMYMDAAGKRKQVVCDYLIKQHQGSWSADATSNNAHELIYASKCTDGTEIITTMLSRFGNANEFFKTCSPQTAVATVGSTLPAGYGGKRVIPDADCLQRAAATSPGLWAMYELWQGDNRITTSDGTVLAEFDPWFGIRNPSRYYDPANGSASSNGISRPLDLAWNPQLREKFSSVVPWKSIGSHQAFDFRDPASPFDGAQRDFYLNQNRVAPEVATSTHFTGPYGDHAGPVAFKGSIKQHLVPGSATSTIELMNQKFDQSADFGLNNGVHAPN